MIELAKATAAQPPEETGPAQAAHLDELGFVSLSKTGAELLLEVFGQRYGRGSILVTTNLPFDKWTEVFGSEPCWTASLTAFTSWE